MGTGAVNGHSKDITTDPQPTENSWKESPANTQTPTNTFSSGEGSSTSFSSTSTKFTNILPQPTDRSKVKSASQMKMSCEMCSVNFTLFKRKKCCQECHRYFCSNCLPKPPPNTTSGRQCNKCRLLVSGRFSRDDLQSWKVKDMRCFLNVRNISTKDCREKHDLIELVLARFCTQPRTSVQDQTEHEDMVRQMAAHVRDISFVNSSGENTSDNSPAANRNENANNTETELPAVTATSSTSTHSSDAQSSQANPSSSSSKSTEGSSSQSANTTRENDNVDSGRASGETRFEISGERLRELLESMERIQEVLAQHEEREEEPPPEPPIRRTQLDDITEVSQINDLSIRQLKELLVNNFVNYKGCCEKAELIVRTKRLWLDHQDNKKRAEQIHKEEELAYYGTNDKSDTVTDKPCSDETEKVTEPSGEEKTEAVESTPGIPEESPITITSTTSSSSVPSATTTVATTTLAADQPSKHHGDSLCHICMDSLVDCILLECGHMVTCTQCGKRLADCPVCRQYIVRVVRVFRS